MRVKKTNVFLTAAAVKNLQRFFVTIGGHNSFGDLHMHVFRSIARAATLSSVLALSACQHSAVVSEPATVPVAASPVGAKASAYGELYQVQRDGRTYVFDDFKQYRAYVKHAEVAYMKADIGAGARGETVIYALTEESKKTLVIPGYELRAGKATPAADFYGEIRAENGRLYVFDSFDEMKKFDHSGEAAYQLAKIGEGPEGQTVVFVLQSKNKEHVPTAMIERFQQKHAR